MALSNSKQNAMSKLQQARQNVKNNYATNGVPGVNKTTTPQNNTTNTTTISSNPNAQAQKLATQYGVDNKTFNEIIRKAENGIQMSAPTSGKQEIYDLYQNYFKESTLNKASQGTALEKPNEWKNNIYNEYLKNNPIESSPGINPGTTNPNTTTPTAPNNPYSINDKDYSSLMQNVDGIGKDINLGFNDWDNFDAVMSQLNASANAVASLSRDNNVTKDSINDIYEHYLKTHARASELGFGGVSSPLYLTGYSNADNPNNGSVVNPEDRGFMGGATIQDQYAKYLGQLGSQEAINKNYGQQALNYLTKLDTLKRTNEGNKFDFNYALGDDNALNEMNRYLNYLGEQGLIDNAYNPFDNTAQMIQQLLGNQNLGLSVNGYHSSGIGNYSNFTVDPELYNSGAYLNSEVANPWATDIEGINRYLNRQQQSTTPTTPTTPELVPPELAPIAPSNPGDHIYNPGASSNVDGYNQNQLITNELFNQYLKNIYNGGF